MEDARVQAQIREAKNIGVPILLVYETERSHGAPLNQDKTFDFARVFNEQAPSDLNTLHHGIEGIAYQRSEKRGGFDRFVGAMLDAIVKQAGAALRGRMVHEASAAARRSSSVGFPGSVTSIAGDIRMQDIPQSTRADGGYVESAWAQEQKAAAPGEEGGGNELRSPLLGPSRGTGGDDE